MSVARERYAVFNDKDTKGAEGLFLFFFFFFDREEDEHLQRRRTTKKKKKKKTKEEEFEEIPPEELEKARIGLYVPERKRETMAFLSRAAKEKALCDREARLREGVGKRRTKNRRKVDAPRDDRVEDEDDQ